jgi:hypothetical protein
MAEKMRSDKLEKDVQAALAAKTASTTNLKKSNIV